MKKILLHIITPVVNILSYTLAFVLIRLFHKFLVFISRSMPLTYQAHEDSIIFHIMYYTFAMVCMAIVTGVTAPSKKYVHYFIIASILLIATIFSPSMTWESVVGSVLGILIGGVYLVTQNSMQNE